MRWLEWVIQDPLARMTVLSAFFSAVLVAMLTRKILTRGKRPALKYLIYTGLACFMFAAPCIYFWHQLKYQKLPSGPLLHTTPSASFKTSSGQTLELESLRGRVVLLDFWASWCAPCRVSSPAIAQMQKRYGPRLVTISVDEDETAAEWRNALVGLRPAYDVFDEQKKLRWTFQVGYLPRFVVLDQHGVVDTIEIGWEPDTGVRLQEAVERDLAAH